VDATDLDTQEVIKAIKELQELRKAEMNVDAVRSLEDIRESRSKAVLGSGTIWLPLKDRRYIVLFLQSARDTCIKDQAGMVLQQGPLREGGGSKRDNRKARNAITALETVTQRTSYV
jgi:hypothetical protein